MKLNGRIILDASEIIMNGETNVKMTGSRIQIDGGEVRILNDDEVLATIKNPEDILHQY